VAVGIGPIAHSNDIGGSVRIPTLHNGIVDPPVSLGRIPSNDPRQPHIPPQAQAVGKPDAISPPPATQTKKSRRPIPTRSSHGGSCNRPRHPIWTVC